MNIDEIEEGMRVRISSDIKRTHEVYTSCPAMHKMCTHTYTVDSVDHDRNYVIIDGYAWDAEDLTMVETKETKPPIFHFDVSHLEMQGKEK